MLTNQGILDPRVIKFMTRLNPASYQDFVDSLYSDLDGILREIQASRKLTVKKYPDVNSDEAVFDARRDNFGFFLR